MPRIKFITSGSNAAVGGFGPGDFATVSDDLAAHLVDDARVAKYADAAKETARTPDKLPSTGLTVDQLKAALEQRGIAIPAGALKADLAKLLDDSEPA